MTEQIVSFIVLLLGIGVILGGTGFLRRITSIASGCVQTIIGLAIGVLLLVLLARSACSALWSP